MVVSGGGGRWVCVDVALWVGLLGVCLYPKFGSRHLSIFSNRN